MKRDSTIKPAYREARWWKGFGIGILEPALELLYESTAYSNVIGEKRENLPSNSL